MSFKLRAAIEKFIVSKQVFSVRPFASKKYSSHLKGQLINLA